MNRIVEVVGAILAFIVGWIVLGWVLGPAAKPFLLIVAVVLGFALIRRALGVAIPGWVAIIAVIVVITSWYGVQYQWFGEASQARGVFTSFQATDAMNPRYPDLLAKGISDTRTQLVEAEQMECLKLLARHQEKLEKAASGKITLTSWEKDAVRDDIDTTTKRLLELDQELKKARLVQRGKSSSDSSDSRISLSEIKVDHVVDLTQEPVPHEFDVAFTSDEWTGVIIPRGYNFNTQPTVDVQVQMGDGTYHIDGPERVVIGADDIRNTTRKIRGVSGGGIYKLFLQKKGEPTSLHSANRREVIRQFSGDMIDWTQVGFGSYPQKILAGRTDFLLPEQKEKKILIFPEEMITIISEGKEMRILSSGKLEPEGSVLPRIFSIQTKKEIMMRVVISANPSEEKES